MAIGILGRKVGMTQLFDEAGQVVPVTVIEAGPCDVLQVRTVERDGYEAIQLGFADKPRRLATRSVRGHVAKLDSKRSKKRSSAGVELLPKADCEPKRFIREIRGPVGEMAVGGQIKVDALAEVKSVDITGTTQRSRFRRCHQATQILRPTGHARCEEVPPRIGRHRCQRVPEPRGQRQADAGPIGQRQPRPCGTRSS